MAAMSSMPIHALLFILVSYNLIGFNDNIDGVLGFEATVSHRRYLLLPGRDCTSTILYSLTFDCAAECCLFLRL